MDTLNTYDFIEGITAECLMPAVMEKLPTTGKPENETPAKHLFKDAWLGHDYLEVVDIAAIYGDEGGSDSEPSGDGDGGGETGPSSETGDGGGETGPSGETGN